MMKPGLVWTLRGIASVALVACFLAACGTVEKTVNSPPTVAGAHYVGNATCVDCHTNIARSFPTSAHGRFSRDDIRFASITGCESCHGAASEHVRVGGGRRFIVNPGKDPSACFQCHLDVHSEFKLPQHHPVVEGIMNCVQCHDPHGHDIMKPAGGLAMARLNQSCAQCHREQSRPFVFEHEALRDGCVTCHNPHGSINRQLLTERDNNLCLKCHVQMQGPDVQPDEFMIGKVPHANFLKRGTCWSSGCHTAVHGSNVNPHMLY